jgi:hypothetical protein
MTAKGICMLYCIMMPYNASLGCMCVVTDS